MTCIIVLNVRKFSEDRISTKTFLGGGGGGHFGGGKFQIHKQAHTDKPTSTDKVIFVEYFQVTCSSLAKMSCEKQTKTQNCPFYPHPRAFLIQ